jgi:hypothetical protein
MSEKAHPSPIPVRLEGGPASLSTALHPAYVQDLEETVKIEHLGGYEHFRLHYHDGEGPAVFVWTTRTKIAE